MNKGIILEIPSQVEYLSLVRAVVASAASLDQTLGDNNPFSPIPKLTPIPIIGEIRITPIKPAIPTNLITSKIDLYESNQNPLKISISTSSVNTKTPSQINPFSEHVPKTPSKEGIIEKMVDKITDVFTPKK